MSATRQILRIEISGEGFFDLLNGIDAVRYKVEGDVVAGNHASDTMEYEFSVVEEVFEPLLPSVESKGA